MKNSEANNNHKNKYRKLKNILSIWSFNRRRFPDGILVKHKARLCAHGVMQQWVVTYWETYDPVINWISVRSLLDIASIHEFPSRSIDFILAFPPDDLDLDVFIDQPLEIIVDGNRV